MVDDEGNITGIGNWEHLYALATPPTCCGFGAIGTRQFMAIQRAPAGPTGLRLTTPKELQRHRAQYNQAMGEGLQ